MIAKIKISNRRIVSGNLTTSIVDNSLDDGDYNVVVFKDKPKRVLSVNKYLWGFVLKTISDATGNSVDDVYSYFESKFLGTRSMVIDGEQQIIVERARDLDNDQFKDFVERIRVWSNNNLSTDIPKISDTVKVEFNSLYQEAKVRDWRK